MVSQITPVTTVSSQSGFNIDDFVAQVSVTGIARPNKHLFRISALPPCFSGNEFAQSLIATNDSLEFYCEGSSIPGISLATHTGIRYGYGSAEKRPFMPIFNDVNLSIFVDDQQDIPFFWKTWIQSTCNYDMSTTINPQSTTNLITVNNTPMFPFELAYRSEYTTDCQVFTFDSGGNVTQVIRLREAFPIFVGDIATNWGDNNSIMRLPISLTYVDWHYDADAMTTGV